jgi:hypothetical protein
MLPSIIARCTTTASAGMLPAEVIGVVLGTRIVTGSLGPLPCTWDRIAFLGISQYRDSDRSQYSLSVSGVDGPTKPLSSVTVGSPPGIPGGTFPGIVRDFMPSNNPFTVAFGVIEEGSNGAGVVLGGCAIEGWVPTMSSPTKASIRYV